MEIKHEHVEMVLLAWAAEVGQAFAANAIAEEYARIGGDQLRLVPGKPGAISRTFSIAG
jgi:hypothetical protein